MGLIAITRDWLGLGSRSGTRPGSPNAIWNAVVLLHPQAERDQRQPERDSVPVQLYAEHDHLARHPIEASTELFLVWWTGHIVATHGIRWSTVWAQYDEYCHIHERRPLSKETLQRRLGKHGCVSRRKRIAGEMTTIYDIVGRSCVETRVAA